MDKTLLRMVKDFIIKIIFSAVELTIKRPLTNILTSKHFY